MSMSMSESQQELKTESEDIVQDADTTLPSSEMQQVLDQLTISRESSTGSVNPNATANANADINASASASGNGSGQQEPEQQQQPTEPPSEWDIVRAQLAERPYQADLWQRLVDLAESSGNIELIAKTYDALLEVYPNTAQAQIAYIDHFAKPGDYPHAETLFTRFLRGSPSVELWRFYLTYVRRVNADPSKRDTIRKSYEFALSFVGQDKDSGVIWSDYIQFLQAGETTNTWEEQQKMDALRKVFHRAVQIPLENIETLWSEYEAFELGLNRITAKKFLQDLNPAYVQARTVLRQLNKHLGPLFPPLPSSPSGRPSLYLPPLPTFNAAERALVGAWKVYLKWEESNPLEIEEKDRVTLVTRLQGVYRKAVIRMRFYPEIWYMAHVWANSVGKHDEALAFLRGGIEAIPSSFLLNFAYTEALETKKDYADVHATFEKFIGVLRKELEAFEAKNPSSSANTSLSSQNSQDTQPAGGENGSANSSFNTQADTRPPRAHPLADRRAQFGLVWIVYMRFGRRAEGVKSSRAIFGRARRDKWTPWQVFEAAALMEYHTSKDKDVASRIFEKGLETYGDEIEYVLRYLAFLISINDEPNARALFERVIPTFSPDSARPLWERWARHEYQYGDLEAAQKLEKRIAEVYPTDPPIKRFAQRHTYIGIDAIAARDLGFSMARHGPTSGAPNGSNGSLAPADSVQNLLLQARQGGSSTSLQAAPAPTPPSSAQKRPASPDHRPTRGGGERGAPGDGGPPPHKRARSPPPSREWERDRAPPRRRFASPAWDRDREREREPPPPPPRRYEKEREEEKPTVLPSVISTFVGMLPPPSVFDGPIFRTDDLMTLLRNAVIPSSTVARSRSPAPAPRSGGRPPPDYGPYQGPGGGRGGRRY